MLEYLAMLGLGWAIKGGGDAAQAAANRGVRKATRAVTSAGKAALQHLDERGPGQPLERAVPCSSAWRGHDYETTYDDGTRVEQRCRSCGHKTRGVT